ncbi:hypothetical protein V6N12_021143 [Hibiscus sabdariffa]|uniref:Uncharacterized protein n=1 Tax=Hibiscus sabdariffa TaxID=183260 RepID=A0ABR2AS31_9ROSI
MSEKLLILEAGYAKLSFLSRLARQSHHAKDIGQRMFFLEGSVKLTLHGVKALSRQIMKQDRDRLGSAYTNSVRCFALFGAGVSGLLGCTTIAYSDEAEHGLEVPNYHWPHQGILSSYDHAS